MNRSRYFLLGAAIVFLLLTIVSCNLPGDEPGGTTEPVVGDDTATEPVDVTTISAPPPANTDGAETILIPGATFWMGSDPVDAQADADEFPRHEVALGGFYIYTHEVTNAMYVECVAAGACLPIRTLEAGPTSHYDDPAFAEHPVTGVDWLMARSYCVWAGGRLPTEAEWELASRGTESLRYPWGEEEPACDRVNMFGCTTPPDTLAVGSLANGNSPYEVWDMSGNVWEWVNDWYDEDYFQLSPSSNPLGPYYGEMKAVRGGGLYSEPVQMRSAARVGANPHRGYDDVGFRCVPEAEALPSGYYPPDEGHEWTEPDPLDGGGEHVDDPDEEEPFASMGESSATCPDSEGRIRIYAEADTSESGAYSVTVEGIPFDCTYDEAAELLSCVGPMPAATEYPDVYHVMIYFPGGGIIGHQYPDIPTDCPADAHWPPEMSASASCPGDDGLVTVSFTYTPAITWIETMYVEGMSYVPMPCVATSPTTMNCTVPARDPGDIYSFSLHGFDADGMEYYMWTAAGIPVDCPARPVDYTVSAGCGEEGPVAEVYYDPSTAHFSSATNIGIPMYCFGMAPGVMVCGPLIGDAGASSTVSVCFEEVGCQDWALTVPTCPGETAHGYILEPACYPEGTPAASLHFWPFDAPLASVEAASVPLTCEDWGGGWYMCPGLPGDPGTDLSFQFQWADGFLVGAVITVPTCGGDVPPEEGEPWRIAAVGCHDESMIYFIVDTYLDWLVPGAAYTYSASDEVGSYSCSVHPDIPGRLYCAGPRPGAPGTLQLCLHPDGGELTCNYYEDFATWVGMIPPCGTEVPPEEPHTPTCADYLDQPTCDSHWAQGCKWGASPAPGRCIGP